MKCKAQQPKSRLTRAGKRNLFSKAFTGLAFAALIFASCSNDSSNPQGKESNNTTIQTSQDTNNTGTSSVTDKPTATAVGGIVNSYLQLKNALAADNGQDAAEAGKQMVDAIQKNR